MEAKDTLVKILKALVETGKPILRPTLIDILVGRSSSAVMESQLDEMETFGICDSQEDDFLHNVLDAAISAGYIRVRSAKRDSLEYTALGKTFIRKPVSFTLPDEEEVNEAAITAEKGVDEIVENALQSKKTVKEKASPKTKLQIKLIYAIDRKIALDDFAETESVALEDVLDDLELLQQQGRKMDINYFTDEVIGEEEMEELLEYFNENGDDINTMMSDYDGVYNELELRLARFVWKSKKK